MDERIQNRFRWDASGCRPDGGRLRGCRWSPEMDQYRCTHYEALMSVRRDLHDQIGSTLAGMAMQLELAWRLVGMDTRTANVVLLELRSDITELIGRVRRIGAGNDTAHHIEDIDSALHAMIRRLSPAVAPRLKFSLHLDPKLGSVPEEVRSAAFWIVWEAVINVIKHSTGRHCTVSLSIEDNDLWVRVEDDGQVRARPAPGGSGIANMAARAAAQGGWCTTRVLRPKGFGVTAYLPLPHPKD